MKESAWEPKEAWLEAHGKVSSAAGGTPRTTTHQAFHSPIQRLSWEDCQEGFLQEATYPAL